jgi:MoaA/NifB/PqqE/SkfB family radical SAM enzyme
MSLGSKTDYLYTGNLKFSKLYNLLKNIVSVNSGKLNYYPRRYRIEPTTLCNLKCPYCIHGKYDENIHLKKENLDFDSFKIIFNQIKKYALMIGFYNFGEPFLNKDTPKMIATATSEGIRSRISSNMSIKMTDDYARQIVESNLYRLTCSIDGHNQEVYEIYRKGGKLETVLENVKKIEYYKKKLKSKYPLMVFRMLVFEWNYKFVSEAEKIAFEYKFDEFYADPGSFVLNGKTVIWNMKDKTWNEKEPKIVNYIPEKSGSPCQWLFTGMVINSNGNVMPCCFSNEKRSEHLSLLEHDLKDIWNSQEYINSRLYTLGLSSDRSNVLPVCKHCRLL